MVKQPRTLGRLDRRR